MSRRSVSSSNCAAIPQPISIDSVEFIEVDGLKIRFQATKLEGDSYRAHEPLAGKLVRLPADLADPRISFVETLPQTDTARIGIFGTKTKPSSMQRLPQLT